MQTPQWNNIAPELRALNQWVIADVDKAPRQANGTFASSTDPSTWTDFQTAVEAAHAARQRGFDVHVGFVLTADDPFTCIDLDVKEDKDGPVLDWQPYIDMVDHFASYTEVSRSGKGLHIWVKGVKCEQKCKSPNGRIEVYDRERFIICTGALWKYHAIEHKQAELDYVVLNILKANAGTQKAPLVELEALDSDATVWERMCEAENGAKWVDLANTGDWAAHGYPSQSEADAALMETLCFYSPSNAQVRELFRMSALGKREKATKNDRYLNYTLQDLREKLAAERLSFQAQCALLAPLVQTELRKLEQAPAAPTPPVVSPSIVPQYEQPAVEPVNIPWPPGRAGELARWIYSTSHRPVPEVSIVATLGYLAGVYGRALNISNSGLNLYVILVARSAIGKEAMHSGLSMLTHNLMSTCPVASEVTCFDQFASAEGMAKELAEKQCFVHVAGEWGHHIKQMAAEKMDSPAWKIKRQLLEWFQKSGATDTMGGRRYSKKEDNVTGGLGLSFSMIGETTPDVFYESLSEGMMKDGFMSRFIVVEYNGERPPKNLNKNVALPNDLREKLMTDIGVCRAMQPGQTQQVRCTPEAEAMLDAFDLECDSSIEGVWDESWRQMWNRAHIKALRVAALLAAIDCDGQPFIRAEHAQWAIDLIRRDIGVMDRKIKGGDVGSGDGPRQRKLLQIMRDYLNSDAGYNNLVKPGMREARVIPYSYLCNRTAQLTLFTQHKLEATAALNQTLSALCDSGHIVDESKNGLLKTQFKFRGRMYSIEYIPDGI